MEDRDRMMTNITIIIKKKKKKKQQGIWQTRKRQKITKQDDALLEIHKS